MGIAGTLQRIIAQRKRKRDNCTSTCSTSSATGSSTSLRLQFGFSLISVWFQFILYDGFRRLTVDVGCPALSLFIGEAMKVAFAEVILVGWTGFTPAFNEFVLPTVPNMLNGNLLKAESSTNMSGTEPTLSQFLTAIEKVQQEDSQWTSEKQLDRLLRPGAKYRNLNPYEVGAAKIAFHLFLDEEVRDWIVLCVQNSLYITEVLQVSRDDDERVIKKQFRKLSFLIHPDKNPDRVEEAKTAFDVVNAAYQTLQDETKMEWVNFVYQEAEEEFPFLLEKKRKEAKKKKEKIPEDISEEQYKDSFRRFLLKRFADLELEKTKIEQREFSRQRKEREQEQAEKEKLKTEKDTQKQWEAKRDERVESWLKFAGAKKEKKKKSKTLKGGLRPPKLKQETRS
eukprot:gene9066-1380_t